MQEALPGSVVMSLAEMSSAEIRMLPPAKSCMVCEQPVSEIGGRRLVAQRSHGTNVFDHSMSGGFENFHSCTRLLDDPEIYLVIWGEEHFLTEGVISRVKLAYREGLRPWFCQACGNRLCHACREILPRPMMSDYVFDDGGIVHCPCLGADPGCWNPDCQRHRPCPSIR